MSVFAVTGVAVIAAMTSVLLKKQNPELSLLISLTAGVIIILFAVHLFRGDAYGPDLGRSVNIVQKYDL